MLSVFFNKPLNSANSSKRFAVGLMPGSSSESVSALGLKESQPYVAQRNFHELLFNLKSNLFAKFPDLYNLPALLSCGSSNLHINRGVVLSQREVATRPEWLAERAFDILNSSMNDSRIHWKELIRSIGLPHFKEEQVYNLVDRYLSKVDQIELMKPAELQAFKALTLEMWLVSYESVKDLLIAAPRDRLNPEFQTRLEESRFLYGKLLQEIKPLLVFSHEARAEFEDLKKSFDVLTLSEKKLYLIKAAIGVVDLYLDYLDRRRFANKVQAVLSA